MLRGDATQVRVSFVTLALAGAWRPEAALVYAGEVISPRCPGQSCEQACATGMPAKVLPPLPVSNSPSSYSAKKILRLLGGWGTSV